MIRLLAAIGTIACLTASSAFAQSGRKQTWDDFLKPYEAKTNPAVARKSGIHPVAAPSHVYCLVVGFTDAGGAALFVGGGAALFVGGGAALFCWAAFGGTAGGGRLVAEP